MHENGNMHFSMHVLRAMFVVACTIVGQRFKLELITPTSLFTYWKVYKLSLYVEGF